MKLLYNTIRPNSDFAEGSQGFILDAQNYVGGSQREVVEAMIRNLETHGKSWIPARFIRFTVKKRIDVNEGYLVITTEEKLTVWMRDESWGLSNCDPMIIRKEEMQWIKEVLQRLGTSDYEVIKMRARDGDADASIILGYCEIARLHSFSRRGDFEYSIFEPEQFLQAASQCEA